MTKDKNSIQIAIGIEIRQLREQKNWTQKELAEKLSMKAPQLSKIESGLHLPSVTTLSHIEAALELTPGKLVNMRSSRAGAGQDDNLPPALERLTEIWQRKDQTSPDYFEDLKNKITPKLDEYCELQEKLTMHPYSTLSIEAQAGTNQVDAEVFAQVLRTSMGVGSAPLTELVPLLEAQNIRIIFIDHPSLGLHAKSFFDNKAHNLAICVPDKITPERQLNEIAMELAYANLYYQKGRSLVADTNGNHNFARSFAQSFLVPRTGIRLLMNQLSIKATDWTLDLVCEIKWRFGVSAQLLIYRLYALGLIESNLFGDLHTELDAHYEKIGQLYPVGSSDYINAIEPGRKANALPRDQWLSALKTRTQNL